MTHRTPLLLASAVLIAAATGASTSAAQQFVSGDVYYMGTLGKIVNVTPGGDLSGDLFVDTGHYSIGQFAWSIDLTTMYVPYYTTGQVAAIDAAGNVNTFATGLSGPAGMLMTREGVLLVAEHDSGEVTNITAGGAFDGAPALTDGLIGPRHLAQLPDGRVLVVDQDAEEVHDTLYPTGGTVGMPWADGFVQPITLVVAADGTTFVATREFVMGSFTGFIYDVTGGGDFTGAVPFAEGAPLLGMAFMADGTMLANELFGTVVWDVTAGGDVSATTPYATGLPAGEAIFSAVPAPVCSIFCDGFESGDTTLWSSTSGAVP